MSAMSENPVEAALRDACARGDRVLASIGPVLVHLVTTPSNALINEEVVASIRGRAAHVATQLLHEQAVAMGESDPDGFVEEGIDRLSIELMAQPEFLRHCHALTIEAQTARCLQGRSGLDPVVSPMLQTLIASQDASIADNAMAILAAQARFFQQHERMELPLGEVPESLFEAVVERWRNSPTAGPEAPMTQAETSLRTGLDDRVDRLGRIERLLDAIGDEARSALSVGYGGLALFASTLALATDQPRETAVLATSEQQTARLALSLRAAGLDARDVEDQVLQFHPDAALPQGLETLRRDRAQVLLAGQSGGSEGKR